MGIKLKHLPDYVTNGIYMPLIIAFISICCFSFFYMRRYRKKYESDRISFLVSVFALVLVFVLTALCPVDTYIVSEMKFDNGTFREWADSEFREVVKRTVLIGYIVLYSLICFTVFCILPFTYFWYDNRNDEDEGRGSSVCSALISTLIVLIIPALIVVISLFIDFKYEYKEDSSMAFRNKIESFVADGGSKVINNLVCVLGGLGMLNLIIYTGFGLSTWPIGLIRGLKDVKQEFDEISRRQMNNTAAINSLKSRRAYLGRLNEEDENLLRQLESKEREDQLAETVIRNHLSSWTYKFKFILRPFQITIGFVFLIFSTVIITSLIINNVDTVLHSSSTEGYFLKQKTIFNPIDQLLLQTNRIYPLDYIIYLSISWYLIFCTLSGVRNLGIGLFFYKLGKFKPGQTTPQGLVLASSVLMMSMLAINILMFSIAPNYSSYGHQVYDVNGTLTQCHLESPDSECTLTRSSYLIETYFYGKKYVGIGFFFSTWFVALFFVLALIYSVCRQSRKGNFNENDSLDFEEDSQ